MGNNCRECFDSKSVKTEKFEVATKIVIACDLFFFPRFSFINS